MRNRQVERPFESWISLGDAGQWISGATPDTSHDPYWGGDVPWISASSLKNFDVIESERRLTRLGSMVGSQMAPASSVIFVVRGMSLKNELRVGVAGRPVSFGQDCKVIIPRNDVDGRFLAYFMLSKGDHFVRTAEDAGHGTKRLVTRSVAEVQVPHLPLAEQQAITEVLDSLGQSIDSSVQYLAKLEKLTSGFVRDAFMSGHSQRSWPRRRLGEFSSVRRGASPRPISDSRWFASEGPGWIRISDVTSSGMYLRRTAQYMSALGAARSVPVRPGQVIMSIAATVGEAIIVDIDARIHDGFVAIDQDSNVMSSEFLSLSLKFAKEWFLAQGQEGTQSNINSEIVREVPLGVPSLDEQDIVVRSLKSAEKRIAVERARLEKLRNLKTGLMDDLLTGRVRVDQLQDLPV